AGRERQLREDRAQEGRLLGRRHAAEQAAERRQADPRHQELLLRVQGDGPDEALQGHRGLRRHQRQRDRDRELRRDRTEASERQVQHVEQRRAGGAVRQRRRIGERQLLGGPSSFWNEASLERLKASFQNEVLAAELELVPARNGRELEQRPAAARVLVGELRVALVPHDLEGATLHLVVEPGAAEDELPQPVDEGLALEQRDALPVALEVP